MMDYLDIIQKTQELMGHEHAFWMMVHDGFLIFLHGSCTGHLTDRSLKHHDWDGSVGIEKNDDFELESWTKVGKKQ